MRSTDGFAGFAVLYEPFMSRLPSSISMLKFFSVAIPPFVSMLPLMVLITRLSYRTCLMFVLKANWIFLGMAIPSGASASED